MLRLRLFLAFLMPLVSAGAEESDGWTDVGSSRVAVPPVDPVWIAPGGRDAFAVERRDGAEGTVDVLSDGTGTVLRITKQGAILVKVRKPFGVPTGTRLCASVQVSVSNAVPERSHGFIRLYGKRENLDFHPLDDRAFMRGGVRMTNLYCTASRVWERKFAHYESTSQDGTNVTCVLIVSGCPSERRWRNWCVEDDDMVQSRWRTYAAARSPRDFSGDRIPLRQFRARLASDVEHTAAVRKVDGVPRLFVDDVDTPPMIYKAKFRRAWETNINTFAGSCLEKVGVRLQSVTVRFGRTAGRAGFWTRDGFDAEGAADYLEDAFRAAPDSFFIPTLHVDAYPEFSAEHPDEVWRREDGSPVYGNGGQAEKVTAHDPAGEGRWPWMSYHSPAWREAVKKNISRLVRVLKHRGLSKRIVGIHLAGYHDAQFATQIADFSPCARAAFARATGRCADGISFGTNEWLVPGRDDDAIAYLRFLKEQPLHLQEDLIRHIRAEFGKSMVSAIWCMSAYSGTMGHVYFTTAFLDSSEIDMLVSQQEYGYRAPGVPLGTKLPFASFRRHGKLYVNEFDYRTWGAIEMWANSEMSSIGLGRVLDAPAWNTVHRRAAGQMFAEHAGFWYYDMGGDYFDDDRMLADIRSVMSKVRGQFAGTPSDWRPSAAFVVDEKGMMFRNISRGSHGTIVDERDSMAEQLALLEMAAVPFDCYLMDDFLKKPELADRYKLPTVVRDFIATHRSDEIHEELLDAHHLLQLFVLQRFFKGFFGLLHHHVHLFQVLQVPHRTAEEDREHQVVALSVFELFANRVADEVIDHLGLVVADGDEDLTMNQNSQRHGREDGVSIFVKFLVGHADKGHQPAGFALGTRTFFRILNVLDEVHRRIITGLKFRQLLIGRSGHLNPAVTLPFRELLKARFALPELDHFFRG